MEHRYIGLIISAVIIFISVITILTKYYLRHRPSKLEELVEEQIEEIEEIENQN